jgi:hypothetical protein
MGNPQRKNPVKLLSLVYAALLHLYPSGFRSEFAAEMQDVFSEALQDAAKRGRLPSTRLFLREMGDIPASLLREGWTRFYAWTTLPWQDPVSLDIDASHPGSWLSAGFAGLPHLLYALALYLPLLVTFTLALPDYRGPALPVFWVMVAAALLIARWLGWPRWSSSWIGYGLAFLLDQISRSFPAGPLSYLAGITWLSLTAILLLWLARRDWISGLMAVLPISPMWIWPSLVSSAPVSLDAAALYMSISLMLSVAVVVIVRLGRWQTALLIILAVILATSTPASRGAPYSGSLALEYQPDPAPWSGANGWMASYTLTLIFTAPLWLMAFWRHTQRRRALGA